MPSKNIFFPLFTSDYFSFRDEVTVILYLGETNNCEVCCVGLIISHKCDTDILVKSHHALSPPHLMASSSIEGTEHPFIGGICQCKISHLTGLD